MVFLATGLTDFSVVVFLVGVDFLEAMVFSATGLTDFSVVVFLVGVDFLAVILVDFLTVGFLERVVFFRYLGLL